MQHVMQQKNFGRGREIKMDNKGSDVDKLIDDIKQGNVQDISWEIMLKLTAQMAKEREEQETENDLK